MSAELLRKIVRPIYDVFSSIHWNGLRALFNRGVYYSLTEKDHDDLRRLLATGNYIILTYRKSHLTTWLIGVLSLIKNGKWPQYAHVLMNVDNLTNPDDWLDYKIMEATGTGVHWSSFMQVFDCDHVCVIKPKNFTAKEWGYVMERLLTQEGKQYDDLFDLADNTQVSCVELVRVALQGYNNYASDFANFEAMIKKVGNLTPQMFRDCSDFEVVLEVKR